MKKSGLLFSSLIALAFLLFTTSCINENIVTFRSLLREMTDHESVTRYPEPSCRLVQFSSYGR
jgi:hypothetical protein